MKAINLECGPNTSSDVQFNFSHVLCFSESKALTFGPMMAEMLETPSNMAAQGP